MSDQTTPVSALRTAIQEFVNARQWTRYHSPKNLAMSIAIEAAELMELFQWVDNAAADTLAVDPAHRARVAEELADVLIYCLELANRLEMDVSTIVQTKMAANGRKYPVDTTHPNVEAPNASDAL